MTVLEVSEGPVRRLRLAGRLNLETAVVLKATARRVITRACLRRLRDTRGVELGNASGPGARVSMLNCVRLAGARRAARQPVRHVREMFEVTQRANVWVSCAPAREAPSVLREAAPVHRHAVPRNTSKQERIP